MVNRIQLLGNLGADPELRHTQSGRQVATMRVATNESYTDSNGQRQERTEWHRCVVWGKQAEACSKFLAKGRQVFVEGRVQNRQWTDKDNVKHWTSEVVASRVQFLNRNNAKSTQNADSSVQDDNQSELFQEKQPETAEDMVQKIRSGDILF